MIFFLILIPFQFTLADWNLSIQYSTLCDCYKISEPNLCSSSQFCQLDMDFQCIQVLDYNCSYFNEQTVLYLCSQLDRCYLNNGQCLEQNNCSELKGSTNQECYSQSNRCGTSINNINQLTQCDIYQDEGECDNSIFNIRFDNVGYGNVCYWDNYLSKCQNFYVKMYQQINVNNMQIYVKLQIIFALRQLVKTHLLKIVLLYGKVFKEITYNPAFIRWNMLECKQFK